MSENRPNRRTIVAIAGVAVVLAAGGAFVYRRRPGTTTGMPSAIRLTCSASATGERTFSGLTSVIVSDGWLEREMSNRGIRLEWVPISGAAVGPMINEGFANHTIDIASYGDLPSIIANAAGVRTKLIVPSGRGAECFLLVPPESSAKSLLDLKGKSIAIHRGRPWELPFSRLVGSLGLTYGDFNVLNLNPQAGSAALAAHKVDALFLNSAYQLVDKGVGKIIWSTAEAPPDWKMRAELWASRDFLEQHPDLTQIVATAYVKAAHWAALPENRTEMLQKLARAGVPVAVLDREYGQGDVWRDRFSPLFDEPVLAHYRNAVQYARQQGMISTDLDFCECYDERFTKAALEELGLESFWKPWSGATLSQSAPG
ncbi:MAG: ABC transporter substrate-binding protein [Polyangiaceae bacterium]|nr:ABC transporter substrate-binding protein [Polyangiaceae bacterium]